MQVEGLIKKGTFPLLQELMRKVWEQMQESSEIWRCVVEDKHKNMCKRDGKEFSS